MRLKSYIIEEYKKKHRGIELSIDEVMRISKHYSDAIETLLRNENAIIMTRATGQHFDYKYVNPKKEETRVSANTFNYYTLIIDNSKSWSKYPKRSQSIICINNDFKTMNDYYYWVVPKNKAIIGECPNYDFWFSFNKKASNMDSDFNEIIRLIINFPHLEKIKNKNGDPIIKYINMSNIYDYMNAYKIKLKRFDSSLSEFKKALNNFDKWFKKQNIFDVPTLKHNLYYHSDWLKEWKGEPFYKLLEKTLNPKENGFKLTTVKYLTSGKESWTDAECLVIHHDNIKEVLSENDKKYHIKNLSSKQYKNEIEKRALRKMGFNI